MMNSLQIQLIQRVTIFNVACEVVGAGQEYLLSSFSRTKNHRAVVAILEVSCGIEHLGEIGTGEGDAGHLVVGFHTSVFHNLCQHDGFVIVGRHVVVVHVGLVVVVAIEELDVVGFHIVVLEPLIEVVELDIRLFDDADGVQVVFRAGSQTQPNRGQQQ